MLGVEGYGSDSDSDNEAPQAATVAPPPKPASTAPKPAGKTGLSLPPPSKSTPGASSSGLALPPPKKKAPKKIAIGLPSLPSEANDDDLDDRPPPQKKARLEGGAGASALLNMLPAPKNKNPIPQAERVLGGGRGPGLVFHTHSSRAKSQQSATVEDADDDEDVDAAKNVAPTNGSLLEEAEDAPAAKLETTVPSVPFLPPHLRKGKANISTEDKPSLPKSALAVSSAPAIDFFSLGSASSSAPSTPAVRSATPTPSPAIPSIPTPSLPSVSSAPKIDDFTPPEPTPTDPYPGYYLLPSGQWAAYDAAYYKTFYDRWKKEYDAHVRKLEKGVKGFEGAEDAAAEVNAQEEMEKAKREIQEREEKKALTAGGQHVQNAPRMNIKGAALGGRARSRHQLTSLLTDAYANREALEERIAQGRKNRKEAGNKYGF